jgi:hypothetical protein
MIKPTLSSAFKKVVPNKELRQHCGVPPEGRQANTLRYREGQEQAWPRLQALPPQRCRSKEETVFE